MMRSFKNKILKFCTLSFLGMALACCDSRKSEILHFKSPDNNLSISVSGEKPNVVDPWNVNIELKVPSKKVTKGIEYYSGTLDYSTVKCVWKDNSSCTLTFDQQDDTQRMFFIEGHEDGYIFRDIGDVN